MIRKQNKTKKKNKKILELIRSCDVYNSLAISRAKLATPALTNQSSYISLYRVTSWDGNIESANKK